MTERIKKLCAYLDPCESFADIGCDHGYCTKYLLDNKLCKKAIVTDISQKCLDKAIKLLAPHISRGECTYLCTDGLVGVDKETSQVLIAGMGAAEIITILEKSFIPKTFVFQPMHGIKKLREYLLERKACIKADEPFFDGSNFYFVIKGAREGESKAYSGVNLEFGLNLESEVTRDYLKKELNKIRSGDELARKALLPREELILKALNNDL